MRERGMALIPTLELWPYELRRLGLPPAVVERVLATGQAQVKAFADLGGQILLGTDVGDIDWPPASMPISRWSREIPSATFGRWRGCGTRCAAAW
jgi:hypothetical protein